MASLLTRIRRGEDIWRGMTLNQYLQRIVDARLSQGYLPPIPQFGVNGQPVEKIPPSFETYAQDIYAAHPVIFGLMEARRSVFSEARFCWRSVRHGNPGDVLPINDGLELLERPWEGAQTGTLLSRMRQDADLGGTAFVVREEATGTRPARLRRLRPDWVHIVLSGDPWTDLDVDFLGIAYAPNGPDNQPVETFLPDQVAVWAPIPDPLAQFRGMSWLTPVIRELQADNAATQHKVSTLKQGAWLGPIVVAPQGTSLEQFKKFVEAADARHAGPNNAGRMVFLAPGSEIKTVAQSLQQLDMKAISGAAETRIAVASRVPAVIAQISEGLQGSSLNTGNYQAAKRQWIDGSLRPDWRSLCEALSTIVPPPDLSQLDLEPGTTAQLWILESDIALLHQDRLEAAEVRQANATTINTLVTAGFEPASIVEAVRDDDLSRLKHTGLTSVQLTPPGMGGPGAAPGQEGQIPDTQGEDAYQQALAELRAGGGVPEEPVEAQRAQILRADVEDDEDGDEAEPYTTRARVPRDGDGDGKRAAYPGGPDIIPVTPRVPNPKPVTGRLRGEVDRPAPPRKVPPAKPPSRPMTPEERRVADALAAGRISKSTAVALLTGRREPEGMDPDRARAFTVGMVHAGYITELAWTGNRERLEAYLRRQDTSTLRMAAPFFGLTLPSDADHAAVVSAFADRAMQLEAPRRELPPVGEVRQSLMSRKVADLRAALRDAGLPVSGRKAELVDRLVAAYGAVRGGGDDTADRPDRGAGSAGRRDGRGRGPRAAGAQSAGGQPDARAAGPAAAAVGGGGEAGVTRPAKKSAPAKKAAPRKATSRVTVSAEWLPGSPRPLSELSAEQAARAARENLVDPAAAAAHIRAQADEAEAAADLLRRPDTTPPDRPTGRQRSVPFTERDRQDSAVRREAEAARLRRLADRIESGSPAPAKAAPAPAEAGPGALPPPRVETDRWTQAALADLPRETGSWIRWVAAGLNEAHPLLRGTRGVHAEDLVGSRPSGLPPLSAERAREVEDAITDAMEKNLARRGRSEGWVSLLQIRDDLEGRFLRSEVDDALQRLVRGTGASGEREVILAQESDQSVLSVAEMAASIVLGGQGNQLVAFSDRRRRSPTAQAAPATPAKKATPAKRTPSLPSRPGRVSVADSRDWTPSQHVAHAEQARQRGDLAEARLHRGLADTKNRELVESGQGVEHLRSLTDRDDARRFLRSLTREQLNALAGQLGVDTTGSRDAVIARILRELFGG